MKFINRDKEMNLLESEWRSNEPSFAVIYGRRRIGKTRLILEFIEDKEGVYYVAEDTSEKAQISDFKEEFADFLDDDFLRETEIERWSQLFDYLEEKIDKEEKLYIAIDEFSYIVKNSQEAASALQSFWDHFLSDSNICLIVSGSIFGLMRDKVLSSSSPLYGRRTRDLLLRPLSPKHALKFLDMSFTGELETWFTVGGIPEYLKVASSFKSADSFLETEFFDIDGYFHNEPYFLLSQEFKEIRTYFSMLNAIAYGNTEASEIANFVGKDTRGIYSYLENLNRLGFIKKEVPTPKESQSGLYTISDIFFDFWFNFVHRNKEEIERESYTPDQGALNTYFGKRFEVFVRENLFRHLPMSHRFDEWGRWWYKDNEIDLVALNEDEGEVFLGECKWSENKVDEEVLRNLERTSDHLRWGEEDRKEVYGLFSKSGFTEELEDISRSRDNLELYDLKDIERLLTS